MSAKNKKLLSTSKIKYKDCTLGSLKTKKTKNYKSYPKNLPKIMNKLRLKLEDSHAFYPYHSLLLKSKSMKLKRPRTMSLLRNCPWLLQISRNDKNITMKCSDWPTNRNTQWTFVSYSGLRNKRNFKQSSLRNNRAKLKKCIIKGKLLNRS